MTTFDTLESSLEDSRPLEVYKFALGTTLFLFTSAEDNVTLGADEYSAEAISRSDIAQGQDERRRVMEITVPSSNSFAQRYIISPPGEKATLTIVRLQRDEVPTFDTQELVYKGGVKSVQFPDAGNTAKISVQSIEAASSRIIPRITSQPMCNNMLYDGQCKVDPSLNNHVGTVTAGGTTSQITVSGASASGLDFTGGYCTPTGQNDFRMVLAQSGDVLTLLLPFELDVSGATVQAFAGCDHLIAGDCALVYDNVIEFNGDAFVPNKNIFQTGLS